MSLHLWIAWFFCPQVLIKTISSNGFIFISKLKHYPAWHEFMQWHIIIHCSIIPFFFFLVCNIAIFNIQDIWIRLSLLYVNPLCPVKPIGKTCFLLSLAIVNLSSLLFSFSSSFSFQYPQPLKLRGDLHRRVKSLFGWSILRMISCVNIYTRILLSIEQNFFEVLIYLWR